MMIKFNLNNNFTLVPEGTRELEISEIKATPSGCPSDIKITWHDSEGGNILETINIKNQLWKLSIICNKAFNVQDGDSMEVKDICEKLKGLVFDCEVVHNQGKKAREDGTFPTFANIKKIISLHELPEVTLPKTMESNKNPRESITKEDTFLTGL